MAQSSTRKILNKWLVSELIGLIIPRRQAGLYTSWYLLGQFGCLEKGRGECKQRAATSMSPGVVSATVGRGDHSALTCDTVYPPFLELSAFIREKEEKGRASS